MLAIRLPADIEARLNALAAATGRSKTWYAREAILENLDDLEDVYLAERRLEDIKAGRSVTYPLDVIERELGLDDLSCRRRTEGTRQPRPSCRKAYRALRA
jgi:RHH-type rel operon transcriptional repressor/antitoxin RelB